MIFEVVNQHALDASTCWWRNDVARKHAQTQFDELVEGDLLVDAHLDALLEAGDDGHQLLEQLWVRSSSLRAPDALADGIVFLANAHSRDQTTFRSLLHQYPTLLPAELALLEWAVFLIASEELLEAAQDIGSPLFYSAVRGLSVQGIHSEASVNALQDLLARAEFGNSSALLDACASSGHVRLLGPILQLLEDTQLSTDSPARFSAARAAVLLGGGSGPCKHLEEFAYGDGPYASEACRLLGVFLPEVELAKHLEKVWLGKSPKNFALAIAYAGHFQRLPWLLNQLKVDCPPLSVLQAVELLTGTTALEVRELFMKDEAAPVGELFHSWCELQGFIVSNVPQICGTPLDLKAWLHRACHGSQQSRELAALHLKKRCPALPMLPSRAHVNLQLQALSLYEAHC